MSWDQLRKAVAALIAIVLLASTERTNAQQTVFNVPSTDVLARGEIYVELDSSFKPTRGRAVGRFASFVPRIVVGLGRNFEAGVNVTGNIEPGSDSTTIVATLKNRIYFNDRKKIAFVAGGGLYLPIRRRTYQAGVGGYALLSKTFLQTRVTGGAYFASRNVLGPNRTQLGAQFAIESILNRKTTIAADWSSGKNSSGYLTGGLIFKPARKLTTYWSYSVGNSGIASGNHFALFEIGYLF